jgi:hypothetical protein
MTNEAVLVEFRVLPHLEVLIRNCVLKLGNMWSHTIVCGNINYSYIKTICNNIPHIKVINLPYDNMSVNDYNNLLLSKEFWNLFVGEKILIYQEDTLIFKDKINEFLKWDFIGAPFKEKVIKRSKNVGNGGFSIRTKSKMIELIEKYNITNINTNDIHNTVLRFMKIHNLTYLPEDIYFSQYLDEFKIGKVSDYNHALKFCSESIYSEDAVGMHCLWICQNNWKNIITNYFENLIKLKENCINNKEKFRHICYKYTNYIRNITLPNFKKKSYYEAVLIEFRILNHLEFLIRNTIIKLGKNWSHTVICGEVNYYYVLELCNSISPDINVIKTNYSNLSPSSYSEFLSSLNFWNLLYGEKILIYQEDSIIFKNNIKDFLQFDFIGAPWPDYQNDNINGVGNGGFSLRTKSKMIKVIKEIHINETKINSSTKQYMNNTNSTILPEDVYFTKNMLDLNIGFVADRKTAYDFSTESILSINSFGGHNFWICDPNWEKRIKYNTLVQFKPFYDIKSLEHRGGWRSIITYLESNHFFDINSKFYFFDVLERDFLWETPKVINNEWGGIIHCTPKTPNYLEIINIKNMFKLTEFIQSLKKCKFIITLSNYIKEYLDNEFEMRNLNINVYSLKHPVDTENIILFDYDSFNENTDKTIIQIGQQLRKVTSIYLLNSLNFKKLWLTGSKNFERCKVLLENEIEYLKIQENKIDRDKVKMHYTKSYEEYDILLSKNIVFIDLFDAAANNTVLECIIRNTPIIINNIPPVVEYLGEDYPLYFNNLDEVPDILSNTNKIYKAHQYLTNMKKDDLCIKYFAQKLINISYNCMNK